MGWLFQKTYLKWREPKLVRRAVTAMEERKTRPFVRPIIFGVAFGMLMGLWYLACLLPGNNPPSAGVAVLTAIGGGLLMTYGLPLLLRYGPAEIRVMGKWIQRAVGNSATIWKYWDIKHCQIASREINGEDVSVLALTMKNGTTSMIGIGASVSSKELECVLSQRGVQVNPVT